MAPSDLPLPIRVSRSAVGWLSAYAAGLAPEHRLLAHPSFASGLGNLSAYAGGFVNVKVNEDGERAKDRERWSVVRCRWAEVDGLLPVSSNL